MGAWLDRQDHVGFATHSWEDWQTEPPLADEIFLSVLEVDEEAVAERASMRRLETRRQKTRRWPSCVWTSTARHEAHRSPGRKAGDLPVDAVGVDRARDKRAVEESPQQPVEDRELAEAQRKIGELSMDLDIAKALLEETEHRTSATPRRSAARSAATRRPSARPS